MVCDIGQTKENTDMLTDWYSFLLKFGVLKKGSVDLSLRSRGLGKLEGGRIIKINPNKVPRVIGKRREHD